MSEWAIYARDLFNGRVALFQTYVDFEGISRLNATGNWVLNIPGDVPGAERIDYRSGIIVERDGVIVFSGFVTRIERHVGRDTGPLGFLQISGKDDLGYLEDRIAYPDPVNFPDAWVQEADDITFSSEILIRHFIEYNAEFGGGGLTWRTINGLQVGTFGAIGHLLTRAARMDNLAELVYGIAFEDGTVRVNIVQADPLTRVLRVDVTPRADRSDRLLLGLELNNLDELQVTEDRATANYVIVAGEGQGIERVIKTVGYSESVNRYGLVEKFVNGSRQNGDDGLVSQGVQEALKGGGGISIAATGRDDASPRYGLDYELGDWLSVSWQDARYKVTATEARIQLNREGGRVVPLFGGTAQSVDIPPWAPPVEV